MSSKIWGFLVSIFFKKCAPIVTLGCTSKIVFHLNWEKAQGNRWYFYFMEQKWFIHLKKFGFECFKKCTAIVTLGCTSKSLNLKLIKQWSSSRYSGYFFLFHEAKWFSYLKKFGFWMFQKCTVTWLYFKKVFYSGLGTSILRQPRRNKI